MNIIQEYRDKGGVLTHLSSLSDKSLHFSIDSLQNVAITYNSEFKQLCTDLYSVFLSKMPNAHGLFLLKDIDRDSNQTKSSTEFASLLKGIIKSNKRIAIFSLASSYKAVISFLLKNFIGDDFSKFEVVHIPCEKDVAITMGELVSRFNFKKIISPLSPPFTPMSSHMVRNTPPRRIRPSGESPFVSAASRVNSRSRSGSLSAVPSLDLSRSISAPEGGQQVTSISDEQQQQQQQQRPQTPPIVPITTLQFLSNNDPESTTEESDFQKVKVESMKDLEHGIKRLKGPSEKMPVFPKLIFSVKTEGSDKVKTLPSRTQRRRSSSMSEVPHQRSGGMTRLTGRQRRSQMDPYTDSSSFGNGTHEAITSPSTRSTNNTNISSPTRSPISNRLRSPNIPMIFKSPRISPYDEYAHTRDLLKKMPHISVITEISSNGSKHPGRQHVKHVHDISVEELISREEHISETAMASEKSETCEVKIRLKLYNPLSKSLSCELPFTFKGSTYDDLMSSLLYALEASEQTRGWLYACSKRISCEILSSNGDYELLLSSKQLYDNAIVIVKEA